MISTILNGMITLMVSKFFLNDIPHAAGFSPGRRLGESRSEAERAKVHELFYGTKETPPRGTGLGERGESIEGRRFGEPKTEAERKETHLAKYGTTRTPRRGTKLKR